MAMTRETVSKQKLGYVAVRQGAEGYIGGYLCADERGVPIEFWHTVGSPVKTTRLQELLYGNTLKPELLGRLITGSLLGDNRGEARITPHALLTEDVSILDGFAVPGITVILVQPIETNQTVNSECFCRQITTGTGDVVIRWKQDKTAEVEELIPKLKSVNVLEPFKRIYNLLDELGGRETEKNEE